MKNKKPSKYIDSLTKKIIERHQTSIILNDVLNILEKWAKDNDVSFIGSFISFDSKNNSKENRVIAFGHKDEIKMHVKTISEMLDEEKDEFINW